LGIIFFSAEAKNVDIAIATSRIFNEGRGKIKPKLLIDIFEQALNFEF